MGGSAHVFRPSSCSWVVHLISLLIPLVPLCRMDIIMFLSLPFNHSLRENVFICVFKALCTKRLSETAKMQSVSVAYSHKHPFASLSTSLSSLFLIV